MRYTFHKEERLCSRKLIDKLFSAGKSRLVHPVKLVMMETELPADAAAQAMFVVPKRQFKKAVSRNKLKRRMREAYRLHKASMYENTRESGKNFALAFIFIGKGESEFKEIEKAILKLLEKVK